MQFIDNPVTLSKTLNSLELEVHTVDANDGASPDILFVNIVFSDGTRLYEPENLGLYELDWESHTPVGILPGLGKTRRYKLPFKEAFPGDRLDRKLGEIAEVFIRKAGDNGWFVGSVLLFANTDAPDFLTLPLLGNSKVNQFLDDDQEVQFLRDWSTESFSVAPKTEANHPLPRSGYRVLGPVIGQVSANSAVILYRVDREGDYKFTVTDANSNSVIVTQTLTLAPTGRFEVNGLQANHQYKFDLSYVRAGVEHKVPNAAGSLLTYPPEDSAGRFTFAFGSCANSDDQVAQGAWTGIRALAEGPKVEAIDRLRLFVHLGDSFYFYDYYMDEVPVVHVETMQAAHLSMRRQLEFLDMAKTVPCCGIWDDHDFAGCDKDSTSIDTGVRENAVNTWLQYWGNQPFSSQQMGLTTRISYGLVDIYLLDGRFNRDKQGGVCFGQTMIDKLLDEINMRGKDPLTGRTRPRVVVLATGSNWNHYRKSIAEYYGHENYVHEREELYKRLRECMKPPFNTINGLLLISGDEHVNEIFHVDLGDGMMAPEFVSSPLTDNSGLSDPRELDGELVASFSSERYRGFATLTIVTSTNPAIEWKATVRYYQEAAANNYESRSYKLENGQFKPE
jgi:hypothetical protein